MTPTSPSIVISPVRYGFLYTLPFELIICPTKKMGSNSSCKLSFPTLPRTWFSTKSSSLYGICGRQEMIIASTGEIGILGRSTTRSRRILQPILRGRLHQAIQQTNHDQHSHSKVCHFKMKKLHSMYTQHQRHNHRLIRQV